MSLKTAVYRQKNKEKGEGKYTERSTPRNKIIYIIYISKNSMKKPSSRALPNEATKLVATFLFPKMGPNHLLFLENQTWFFRDVV